MIPKASQRKGGQDLATHLLNAQQNEVIEIVEMRGSVADDLHGAFAEWAFQADAFTKCQNYLYSLSINPDKRQGELTRAQYFDYIRRVDEKLGLTNQPRTVVFHTKYGREHCHVVWSRIDAEKERAVQLSYDKEKLMVVTRQFARDHHLELPKGYYTDTRGEQLTLYELHQKRMTGLSKAQHKEVVTDLWRQSDSPKAFVQALAEQGYVLATGDRTPRGRSSEAAWPHSPTRLRRYGRPYVLVNFYGGYHALPRLIDDKTIRQKDIQAFLEKDYPVSDLPTVEDAKAHVDQHRRELETHFVSERYIDAIKDLEERQAERRQGLEANLKSLRVDQHQAREALAVKQRLEQTDLKAKFTAQTKAIRQQRHERKLRGLAAFLGRVSGVNWLRKQMHKLEDRKRHQSFMADKEVLKQKQQEERDNLARTQALTQAQLKGRLRSFNKVDRRERQTLEEELKREVRDSARDNQQMMPSVARIIAKSDQIQKDEDKAPVISLEQDFNDAVDNIVRTKDFDLTDEFKKAAEPIEQELDKDSRSQKHEKQATTKRVRRRRKRTHDLDRGR